jgi:hypothetical protein
MLSNAVPKAVSSSSGLPAAYRAKSQPFVITSASTPVSVAIASLTPSLTAITASLMAYEARRGARKASSSPEKWK